MRKTLSAGVIPAQAGTQCTHQRRFAIDGIMPDRPCGGLADSTRQGIDPAIAER
jgi:hypothetical protein